MKRITIMMCTLVAFGLLHRPNNTPTALAGNRSEIKRWIQSFTEVTTKADLKHVGEAEEIHKKLFLAATAERLERLKTHEHPGIALQAAWEEVRRSTLTVLDGNSLPEDAPPPEALAVQRFVGFVEGRQKLRLPKPFENFLLQAKIVAPGEIVFYYNDAWPPLRRTYADLRVVQGQWASQDEFEKRLLVSAGGGTASVPLSFLGEAGEQGNAIALACVMNETRCFVGFLGVTCSPWRIMCFDRQDSRLLWATDVWGGRSLGGFSGGDDHCAWLRVHDGHVYVFGMCARDAYIEAFDLDTGAAYFRFGTGY